MKLYIYGLCCPITNEVRYVGQTKSPKERYVAHIYSGVNNIRKWVTELKQQGLKPYMKILDVFDKDDVSEEEKFYISKYKNLLNNKNAPAVTAKNLTPYHEEYEKGFIITGFEEPKKNIPWNKGKITKRVTARLDLDIDQIEYIKNDDRPMWKVILLAMEEYTGKNMYKRPK